MACGVSNFASAIGLLSFSKNCEYWLAVDNIVYAVLGIDAFVFNLSGSGEATSIELEGIQCTAYSTTTAKHSCRMRMTKTEVSSNGKERPLSELWNKYSHLSREYFGGIVVS